MAASTGITVHDNAISILSQGGIVNKEKNGRGKSKPAISGFSYPKIMSATTKHKKRRFDTSKFKKNVLTAYNAVTIKGGAQLAWCQRMV
jgi:hypothetical protein